MKIEIRDFAPIKEASIELDGLTVIAGDNDTGKSTVGKLAYALIDSIRQGQLESSNPFKAFFRMVNAVFGTAPRSGIVEYGPYQYHMTKGRSGTIVTGSGEFHKKLEKGLKEALLVESPLIWQLFDTFQVIAAEMAKFQARDDHFPIPYPYTFFDAYSRLNGSVKPREATVEDQLAFIESAIDGKIVFKNNSPSFQRGELSIPMESVATGIQSFGFIQRILELGLARPGFLLILDEPEVHLHPKWQLQYAKLLVEMVDKFGMSVLLTTHSAVFVETLDYVGKKKLGEKCRFYLSEREGEKRDGSVVMRDVSADLDPIYEKLANPLIQLSMFQGDA